MTSCLIQNYCWTCWLVVCVTRALHVRIYFAWLTGHWLIVLAIIEIHHFIWSLHWRVSTKLRHIFNVPIRWASDLNPIRVVWTYSESCLVIKLSTSVRVLFLNQVWLLFYPVCFRRVLSHRTLAYRRMSSRLWSIGLNPFRWAMQIQHVYGLIS